MENQNQTGATNEVASAPKLDNLSPEQKDLLIEQLTADLVKANAEKDVKKNAIKIGGVMYNFKPVTIKYDDKIIGLEDLEQDDELAEELLEITGNTIFEPLLNN